MSTHVAPYGTWRSPITAQAIARGSVSLYQPSLGNAYLWWVEARPAEGGRAVIVRANLDGSNRADVLEAGYSAETQVHEYGGGDYRVLANGDVVFSNESDGRAYRLTPGAEPEPLTPEPSAPRNLRYADFAEAPDGSRIFCVRESHEGEGEPVNDLVAITSDGVEVVASGHDFYAAPRPSPDGKKLAYLTWDHPRMPWDGTELWLDDELVAGGPGESIVDPQWSPDGRLHWVSERSGWWNLYREGEPLYPVEAEFGFPMWELGESGYAFMDDGRIACIWSSDGFLHFGLLDPAAGAMEELHPELGPSFDSWRLETDGRVLAYVGASPTRTPAVVVLDPSTADLTMVATSSAEELDPAFVSQAQPIEYDSHGRRAHALYFPPHNASFEAPNGEKPPLLVMSHGGPTGQTSPELDPRIQFWTSRGIAVVDVNYGGSTGYGRDYRELLRDQWGVVDLEDCVEAAMYLAREGLVDGERLAIRGRSAGGYTTLCALAFTDTFSVGAEYYGIADITAMFEDTHKFESRYGDGLVPLDKARERSPIWFVDRISAPVIVFQGLDDKVVPPSQSEAVVAALRENGIEHEYRTYEGESHGFRKAETIIDSLEAELGFYGRILGFEPSTS